MAAAHPPGLRVTAGITIPESEPLGGFRGHPVRAAKV